METFELRYFLSVARTQNIHKASEALHVSPGSLSKAITRLENELLVNLFTREGRNIRITEEGKLLQKRATEILQLEESTRLELSGSLGTVKVQMAGAEIHLGKLSVPLIDKIKKKYPQSSFELVATDDETAIAKVLNGEVHLAFITSDVPLQKGLKSKVIEETKFLTYVGKDHPLYIRKSVQVEELLTYGFVSPSHPLLGKVQDKQSLDGWRDDEFPRKIEYITSSLKILEGLVVSGKAIAYLPDYFGASLDLKALKVIGCPYTCSQKIKLIARNQRDLGWLNQVI